MIPLIFNKSIYFYLAVVLAFPTLLFATENSNSHKILNVGVRAVNGMPAAEILWKDTIDVLNKNITGYKFKLLPIVGFNEMRIAAKNKKIDFILTNPLASIQLNKLYGLTQLLTLNKKQPNGLPSTTFASVIFTLSNRKDITELKDLHNKSIMAVDPEAFGGWKMSLRELLDNNFDPFKKSSAVLFTRDSSHQSVVNSVLSGTTDVGVVRTGILEQLAKQGKIKLKQIKILNQHKDKLSALHSTKHYPEWPFSVMPHISSEISNKVFHALLSIKSTSKAATNGKYISWTAPLDYSEVYNLTNILSQHYITFEKIWGKYWLNIILFLVFLFSIILYTIYLLTINKKLAFSELKLSQHKDRLEEKVIIRTKELSLEKSKSDEANKAKSEFLSNMSHELRTPLNAIMGFAQLIEIYETDDKDILSATHEISSAGKYLLSLINEILDLAAIESGKSELNLEPVLCNEILKLSLDIIKPLLDTKNITVHINNTSDYTVMADIKRLQQICINLLSNAIKYNKNGGSIEIKINTVDKKYCKFSIKDSGIGIKTEFFHKIFQPFVRDRSNTDIQEGTGVGLVITKKLVEQMHGEIGFNSEHGIGTEFWVTLPAHENI